MDLPHVLEEAGPIVQPGPGAGEHGAGGEHQQRQRQTERGPAGHGNTAVHSRPAWRAAAGWRARPQVERPAGPGLKAGVGGHDGRGEDQLHQREEGRRRQVEQVDRLAVDLHFHGGQAGPAQDQDHAEAGEAEGKDQHAGGQDGRQEQRQRHQPEGAQRGRRPGWWPPRPAADPGWTRSRRRCARSPRRCRRRGPGSRPAGSASGSLRALPGPAGRWPGGPAGRRSR